MTNYDQNKTQILDNADRVRYNMPPIPGSNGGSNAKSSGSSTGKIVALGALGAVAGIAGAAGISTYAPAPRMNEEDVKLPDPEETADVVDAAAQQDAADKTDTINPSNVASKSVDINVPDLGDIHLAIGPSDSMSFNTAFSVARNEVGPHGIFEWRGGVYGTYYQNEWAHLPQSYREEFSSHDWTQLCATGHEPVGVDPDHDYPDLYISSDEGGRPVIALTDAFTGETVHYYPDGSMVPVFDDYGQVICMIDSSELESVNPGDVIVFTSTGDIVCASDPFDAVFAMVSAAEDPGCDVDATEVYADYDDSVVEAIIPDAEISKEFDLIDSDPAVLVFDDDVIESDTMTDVRSDVIEVIEDDSLNSFSEQAHNIFPDEDTYDTGMDTFDDYTV
ncbi:MAG: hypothetical protein NC111_05130 [Bacteroides sp.]|nr:hypothetical protein [Bacteroides sp.]MCM1413711.1 hypothetical protein [Bacteroides sp.]MCM1471890.1 hypothetical protein [Bacteroides sp.]